jgi:hypothetical protein
VLDAMVVTWWQRVILQLFERKQYDFKISEWKISIPFSKERRKGNGESISLTNASGNNLKMLISNSLGNPYLHYRRFWKW